jgi:histidinol phosphatase-like PHP family hydrolase
LDVVDVARVCAGRGTLIELNSKKISFRPIDFERMAQVGAKFIINSDAHSPKRVGDIARAEEFLKNCDYDQSIIINLNQTFTEYKSGKKGGDENISERNQDGNPTDAPSKKRGWRRWF